ncbi:putative nuclease HARBI1 [Achroia grisella]|uniref:putative nuclease HARBI1 n=1 Tax=Achroia grisella TaxID=688607 RepID=UPI0027D30ACB|nr:putative nuclease HARBI1 [Achroia grisella]
MDLVDLIDFEDLEDVETLGTFRRPNRHRIRQNPFEMCDNDFKYKHRFTKRFGLKIVEIIHESIVQDPRGCPISPELQVVCALRNWARHEIQDDTADLYGISQPVVSKICKKVAGALASVSSRFIKMPATIADQEETMRKFRSIANFPTVIGAIDCTHIRIKKINADDGQLYINRKGYPSLNVQVVCNADLKIMDIVTRWRGSVHDSRIFRECRLKQRFEAGAFSGILLGDSGYPCTPYLFTPVLHTNTPQEETYNRCHIQTRNTIERCFGLWKQRFRCLLRGMFGDIETARMTVVACAVLHNIAIDMKEDIFPGEITRESTSNTGVLQQSVHNTLRGTIRRRQFIETHF